jgi:hypothetical protein
MLEKTESAIENGKSRAIGKQWTQDTQRGQTTQNMKDQDFGQHITSAWTIISLLYMTMK